MHKWNNKNIIFLDIDGVLNGLGNGSEGIADFDEEIISDKVKLLADLCKETDSLVVLHSGWRFWFDNNLNPLNPDANYLVSALEKYGIAIDDITPDLSTDEIKRTKRFSLVKAEEILLWVKKHPTIKNWIVLDDLDLHNSFVSAHHIQTKSDIGLTTQDCHEAISLLNGNTKNVGFEIREVIESDVNKIVAIYNSNTAFLNHHLGVDKIDEGFIRNELREMKEVAFLSNIVIDSTTNEPVGVIDYKPTDAVYLSLMMIDYKHRNCGIGTAIYRQFEKTMQNSNKMAIRIDVVNDYEANAVGFWEKQGFISQEDIKITWGCKESSAVKMIKLL